MLCLHHPKHWFFESIWSAKNELNHLHPITDILVESAIFYRETLRFQEWAECQTRLNNGITHTKDNPTSSLYRLICNSR